MMSMILMNPRLMFYTFLSAAFLIGAGLGFLAARRGADRRVIKLIDLHTENALSARDAALAGYLEDIAGLETEIDQYQARFKQLVVFLGKAIEAVGGVR